MVCASGRCADGAGDVRCVAAHGCGDAVLPEREGWRVLGECAAGGGDGEAGRGPAGADAQFGDWLGERGFERAVDKLRWYEYDPADVAGMSVERLAELLS